MATPAPAEDDRCRSILAALLSPIDRVAATAWADRLVDAFGSLGGVLAEPRENIRSLTNDRVAILTGATADAITHTLRMRLDGRRVVAQDQHLRALLVATMADLDHEQLRVLFLDRGNRLLADEIVSRGTVSRLTIHPRMVIRRAIALNATALILVHNHPGGQADPSNDDIEGTRRIVALAAALDIAVHDHLIVAAGNVASMRARGLL